MLKPGLYSFVITGVLDKNKDGTPLVSKKTGHPYKKLKLDVFHDDGVEYVYPVIFDKAKVAELVHSLGDEALVEKLKVNGVSLESLIGRQGNCVIGHKTLEDSDKVYVNVRSYVYKSLEKKTEPVGKTLTKDKDDDLPF